MKTTIREDTTERHKGKYENTNFVHQLVLGRFLDAIAEEIRPFQEVKALDFGCGEAFFWSEMRQRGIEMQNLTGIDLRQDAIAVARADFPHHTFVSQDIMTWEPAQSFDLVIASQVLEHLPHPATFLNRLLELTVENGYLLCSVPWEPFFRLSNLARGRDLRRLGNHPEHVNLWGKRGFRKFLTAQARVIQLETVFPFLYALAMRR